MHSLYTEWKTWLHMLHPYTPPPDPLHVTLFCDRNENWVYHEAFMDMEGKGSEVTSTCLFAGPEGVAAAVTLPYEFIKIYEMAAEARVMCALWPYMLTIKPKN